MPKIGMEAIRRRELLDATIGEIGRAGSLEVTVGQIAKRAGVSSALAHHYFGSKDQLFLAAMRRILIDFKQDVLIALTGTEQGIGRVRAIVEASFSPSNFQDEVINAWLNFYVHAQSSSQIARLLRIYQKRMRTNLTYGLRPILGDEAPEISRGIASMIDGLYIRLSVRSGSLDPEYTVGLVMNYVEMAVAHHKTQKIV